jgi:hypothetical protein
MLLFWGGQPEKISSGLYFILYTRIFSFPFLVFLLFFLKNENEGRGKTLFVVRETARILVLSPFLVKLPVLGLHF